MNHISANRYKGWSMSIARILDELKILDLPKEEFSPDYLKDPQYLARFQEILTFCIALHEAYINLSKTVKACVHEDSRVRDLTPLVLEELLPQEQEDLNTIQRVSDKLHSLWNACEVQGLPTSKTELVIGSMAQIGTGAFGKQQILNRDVYFQVEAFKQEQQARDKSIAKNIAGLIKNERKKDEEEIERRQEIVKRYLAYLISNINLDKNPATLDKIASEIVNGQASNESFNESRKDALVQYKYFRELEGILRDDKRAPVNKLNLFDGKLILCLPAITKRCDSMLMTVLKCLGVIFSAGYFYHSLFGKNATEGKKTVALLQAQPDEERLASLKAGR